MNEKIILGDALFQQAAVFLDITADHEGNLKDHEGFIMKWEDGDCREFTNLVTLPSIGQIDAVLIFGDGTLEFRYMEDGEAINWGEFSNEDLRVLLDAINKEL